MADQLTDTDRKHLAIVSKILYASLGLLQALALYLLVDTRSEISALNYRLGAVAERLSNIEGRLDFRDRPRP